MEGGSVVAGYFDVATLVDHLSHYNGNILSLLKSFTWRHRFCFTSGLGNQVLSARSPLNKVTTFPLMRGDTTIDNKSLLTLLPCRSKGGISQYPQFVFGLWRNWNISQRKAQRVMEVLTNTVDSNETRVWIMMLLDL